VTTGADRVRTTDESPTRLDPQVESAAYFCVVELLRELAGPGSVGLRTTPDELEVEVTGPLPAPSPERIAHLHDRAAALDGRLDVAEADGVARMTLHLPLCSPSDEGPHPAQAVGVEVGLGDVGVRTAR
jgi:hypothetical protein